MFTIFRNIQFHRLKKWPKRKTWGHTPHQLYKICQFLATFRRKNREIRPKISKFWRNSSTQDFSYYRLRWVPSVDVGEMSKENDSLKRLIIQIHLNENWGRLFFNLFFSIFLDTFFNHFFHENSNLHRSILASIRLQLRDNMALCQARASEAVSALRFKFELSSDSILTDISVFWKWINTIISYAEEMNKGRFLEYEETNNII